MIIVPDSLREINRRRCERWHDPETDTWTLGDWGNAFGGEAGELQNIVKKMRRHESGASLGYNTPEMTALRFKFAEEVADVLLYLDLLCWEAGVSQQMLEFGLRDKFNLVSRAQGWDDLQWDSES